MDEMDLKVESFKKRMSKSEKLSARMSEFITDEKGTAMYLSEDDFQKLLSGEEKIYFSYGSIHIELDGDNFDIRYCDKDKEPLPDGKTRLTSKDIFEKMLGESIDNAELDRILSDKFSRGDYKIVGNIQAPEGADYLFDHKSEQGRKILDCQRKTKEIAGLTPSVLEGLTTDKVFIDEFKQATSNIKESAIEDRTVAIDNDTKEH